MEVALRRIRSAGIATLFAERGVPLPALFRERDDPAVWRCRNRLVAGRHVFSGLVVRDRYTFIARDLLAPLAALLHAGPLDATVRHAAERLARVGAMSTLRLRESLGLAPSAFRRVYRQLNRRLLIAQVGCDHTEGDSALVDRLDRVFPAAVKEALTLPRAKAIARVRARLPGVPPRFLATLTGVRATEWKR